MKYGNYRNNTYNSYKKQGYTGRYVGTSSTKFNTDDAIHDILEYLKDVAEMLKELCDISRTNLERVNPLSCGNNTRRPNKMAQTSSTPDEAPRLCVREKESGHKLVQIYDEGSRDDGTTTERGITNNVDTQTVIECEDKDTSCKGTTDSSNKKHRRRNVDV